MSTFEGKQSFGLKRLGAESLAVTLVAILIGGLLYYQVWVFNPALCHLAVELIYIMTTLLLFIVTWQTYRTNSSTVNILGLGFFSVTIFEFCHVLFSPELNLYPPGYLDLGTRYFMCADLLQAILVLIICLEPFRAASNKCLGLVLTSAGTLLIALVLFYFPGVLPALYVQGIGATFAKKIFSLLTILTAFTGVVLLRKKLHTKTIIAYNYIFVSLILSVAANVALSFYLDKLSLLRVTGHVLKLFSIGCLFRGTVINAITYPYEKLERNNAYMAKILDGLPVGVITWDSKDCLTFANEKVFRLLGYDAKLLPPDDKGLARLEELEHIRNITVQKNDGLINSCSSVIKTPNRLGEEMNLRVEVMSLGNEGYIHLLTDAKQEQELENLQLQTKTILNSVANMIFVVNREGKIIVCNEAVCQLLQKAEEDLLGMELKDYLKLVQCSDRSVFVKTSDKDMPTFEVSIWDSLGERLELVFQKSPILNVEGDLIGDIYLGSDVTKLKKEELMLRQQEKLAVLGQMAAGLVHEIKNPLTSIKGFSQIIGSKVADEQIKQYVHIIESEANDVNEVVSDFLAFAKPHPPELKLASLNELIDSMSLLMESQLFLQGISITKHLDLEEKPILADSAQLKHVILNFVRNAIDAMMDTRRPELAIHTRCDWQSNEMSLIIRDNGIGLSPEEQMKLGTPFYTTKDKGTGLGLSICYQTIQQHGGRIEVDSEVGRGTSFYISFPCI